jgi:DNA repair exonuclease SbcCD ATPase subunit
MRETKEQRLARLEKLVEQQKQELVEMRKERKQLKYRIQSLENKGSESSQQEIKDLQKQLKQAQKQLENAGEMQQEIKGLKKENRDLQKRLNYADEQNERLTIENRSMKGLHEAEIDEYEARIAKIKQQISQLEKDSKQIKKDAIHNIANSKSNGMINGVVLDQFASGEKYYDSTIFNVSQYGSCNPGEEGALDKCKEAKKPFFSTEDLIIRINPNNGMELSQDEIDYIAALLEDEVDYTMALIELRDYSCFHEGEDLINYAYEKGMQLLSLYRDKVFE